MYGNDSLSLHFVYRNMQQLSRRIYNVLQNHTAQQKIQESSFGNKVLVKTRWIEIAQKHTDCLI